MVKFNSHAERMAHPTARLIPHSLWNDYSLFDQNLPEVILSLMHAQEADLAGLLDKTLPELQSEQQKTCAWLAMTLSHHTLSIEALQHIGRQLKMSDERVFHAAILWGDLNFFDALLGPYQNVQLQEMIAANNYDAFRSAAENGHLAIINRLMEIAPNAVQAMIAAYNYHAFSYAARNGHLAIANRLLSYPTVLAYAEQHVQEYSGLVTPFIDQHLATLRAAKATFEAANPNAVFDVLDPEQAKLLYYMLRNLIRRNDPALRDTILFLLEIPAVKALSPIAVTQNEPNALLRLAFTLGNQSAAELLLTIPAIRNLAAQYHYYRNEVRGGMNLAAMAQDNESSMRALSTGEEKRLAAALARYQPMIQAAGVPNLMAALRDTLTERYHATPASIMITSEGKAPTPLILPIRWEDFQQLHLTPAQRAEALTAYYQNKDHAALRYLSKPNPWMHEQAAYVTFNPSNPQEKWSTFEEYQSFIAMLFLAAQDTEIPPTEGYTLETRLDHFIDELAHIARAHN